MTDIPTTETLKRPRGFAAMDPEKRRRIAKLGGAAVKAENRSFSKNRELAAKAGAMGGAATRGVRKAHRTKATG